MRVTIDHSASSYGVPVILSDSGEVMDYAAGIKATRVKLGLTARQLAAQLGVSERTVNGWEGGRMPDAAPLNMLGKLLQRIKQHSSDRLERRATDSAQTNGACECGCSADWTPRINKIVAAWHDMPDAEMRLRCGELTAQEIRTVRAVLNAILDNIADEGRR